MVSARPATTSSSSQTWIASGPLDRTMHVSNPLRVIHLPQRHASSAGFLGRPSRRRECLLEKNDLARMVQVVLRRAAELNVRRVLGTQLLRKALRGEGAHGALELLIQLVQGVLARVPGLRARLRHWRPLFFRRELRGFSMSPRKNQSVSTGQVKDDLPDAV